MSAHDGGVEHCPACGGWKLRTRALCPTCRRQLRLDAISELLSQQAEAVTKAAAIRALHRAQRGRREVLEATISERRHHRPPQDAEMGQTGA